MQSKTLGKAKGKGARRWFKLARINAVLPVAKSEVGSG